MIEQVYFIVADIFDYDILLLHGEKDQNDATECKTFLMKIFPDISHLYKLHYRKNF